MKRFLTTSFIALALFVGATGVAAPIVHAQATPAADATPVNATPGSDIGSGLGTVMTWIMALFAEIVGIAMITLNYAMYYTVLNMGSYVSQLAAVGVTWRILRDLGNIVLIFGFLALGITTILNVNWYGIKKMLPLLIVVAVFLNFSLFISEAVIDVGNLFATQIYAQINDGTLPTPATLTNQGISGTIMSQFGLATIYGNVAKAPGSALLGGAPWYTGFMAILLFIVLAFVLFSLAFILIARFVILLFLIIVAPLGFAGLIVPKLQNTARGWWSMLFEQTVTAPVLLLLLYIALAVITDAKFLTGFNAATQANQNADWLGIATNNLGGFAAVFLPFLVGMALLAAVVIVSKKMSAFGGGWATRTAGALSFGAVAWGTNRTVGRGAYYVNRAARNNKTFNKINAATGRVMTRTLDRASTGTFDVRSTKLLGALPGGKIDAGTAAKEGFVGARDRTIKDAEGEKGETKRIETALKDAHKGNSPENIAAIKAATERHEDAQAAKGQAQQAKNQAQREHNTLNIDRERAQAEVNRLTAVIDSEMRMGRPNSEASLQAQDRLKAAQERLASSEEGFYTAKENLESASQNLERTTTAATAAEKMRAAAEAASGNQLRADIRENKTAYAEGITSKNPASRIINFVAYGPDTTAAARKIKESLKDKSNDQKILDLLKQSAKEAEEAAATGAATTTPPASAAAGAAAPSGGPSHS